MLSDTYKKSLHAIESITEFETDVETRNAVKQSLPLIESAPLLLQHLEDFLNLSKKISNEDLTLMKETIHYARTGCKS